MMNIKSMKWRNAYLLFYERKIRDDIESEEEGEKVEKKNDLTTQQNEDVEMEN